MTEALKPVPVARFIEIPDNVTADVVEAATSYLQHASEAEAEGGLRFHGFWSISHHSTLRGGGASTVGIRDALMETLSHAYTQFMHQSGLRCVCAKCAGRRGEAPDIAATATDEIISKTFKNRGGQ